MYGEFDNLGFKYEYQDKYIAELANAVPSELIQFWTPERRHSLTEEQIDSVYNNSQLICKLSIDIIYPKKTNASKDLDKMIGKATLSSPYFEKKYRSMSALARSIPLDPATVSLLKIWAKNSARFFKRYFWEKEALFLRFIRFELMANKDNTLFELANLPLEAFEFSREPRSEILDTNKLLFELFDDYTSFMNSDYFKWKQEHLNDGTSQP